MENKRDYVVNQGREMQDILGFVFGQNYNGLCDLVCC